MYQQLVAYTKEHTHTIVPTNYKKDPQLARCVSTQHVVHRVKKMTEGRKYFLDSIGFVWELSTRNKASREEMYQRLGVYNKEHKHTLVSTKYKEDPQLGYCVNTQRVVYRDKKMTEERKHLLNSIGFAWKIRPSWISLACLGEYYTGTK